MRPFHIADGLAAECMLRDQSASEAGDLVKGSWHSENRSDSEGVESNSQCSHLQICATG